VNVNFINLWLLKMSLPLKLVRMFKYNNNSNNSRYNMDGWRLFVCFKYSMYRIGLGATCGDGENKQVWQITLYGNVG